MPDPIVNAVQADAKAVESKLRAKIIAELNAADGAIVATAKAHLVISHGVAAGLGAALLALAQHYL